MNYLATASSNILKKSNVLILGGGGLVGSAIAKHLGRLPLSMRPSRVVVAALTQAEAERTVQDLETASNHYEFENPASAATSTKYVPAYGDIFVPQTLAHILPQERKYDPVLRKAMIEDLMGDFESSYEQNHMVSLIREHKPNVIIDCINTATILSYQDIFTASARLYQAMSMADGTKHSEQQQQQLLREEAEKTILSLMTPQLIRHVRFLQDVTAEQKVKGYLKIGTTGTGGMGMNIPYTHSEDRPSRVLLSKSEAAFGHSGLLLLWSITPGAPIVKELKPAAAIGYRTMDIRQVSDKHGNSKLFSGRIVPLQQSSSASSGVLSLREDPSSFPELGPMRMAVIDMGENGVFTEGEFLTITTPGQMELISPEEISEMAIEELLSVSTGHNILSAMRGSLLGPGYRAGINRMMALEQLEKLCDITIDNDMASDEGVTAASVALGKLGPPTLSKLLFEARILANEFGTWKSLCDCDPETYAAKYKSMIYRLGSTSVLEKPGTTENILQTAVSVGVPILCEEYQLFRGPNISIPEPKNMACDIPIPSSEHELDTIADKGWVDLRRNNFNRWRRRAQKIIGQQYRESGASLTGNYLKGDWSIYKSTKGDLIDPPAVVAWILATELGGHRDIA